MTNDPIDTSPDYTDEEWWLIDLRDRSEDDLNMLTSLVEVKDDKEELANYFYEDYSGDVPAWLNGKIERYEVDHLLSMGEGSHGIYMGLYELWDKESKTGVLIGASVDDKFPFLTSFHNDQGEGLSTAIIQSLKECFDYLESDNSGKKEFDDIAFLDPEHISSSIDIEMKELIQYLYDITEGGLMRERWSTAEEWIKEALPA